MSARIKSLVEGALIALAGGGVAAVVQYMAGIDWSTLGPWAGTVATLLIAAANAWLKTHPTPTPPAQ